MSLGQNKDGTDLEWLLVSKPNSMLHNYFKIAIRTLLRNKVYSLINISGLSMGIACCLLLALYVLDEFSYDQHHDRLDDLYRIDAQFEGEGFNKQGSISPPIAMALRDELAEVESAVRLCRTPGVAQSLIKYEEHFFYESDGFVVDSTLFDVFTYDLKEGNPKKALTDANTVVISESLAHRIFGNEPALDKSISISQGGPSTNYKVTGVFREDRKSFIKASFFTSIMSEGLGEYLRTNPEAANEWGGQNFIPSFVKLIPGHSRVSVEKKMNDVLIKHGAESMKALGMKKTLFLEPVKNIHVRSAVEETPRITYLYILLSIGLFILLIACINFMNLSTAKATQRASEIGIRKVMGAFRSSLIRQILGEAMLMVVVSIVISMVLVELALPYFNELSGKSISFNSDNLASFLAALTALTIITGLVAGSYPAFYLSSFQPAKVLKGKVMLSNASGRLRQSLVVFQFIIAIVLACWMLVISRQLTFMQEKDLGFDSHAKIVIPLRTRTGQDHYEALKNELLRNSAVRDVSGTVYIPGFNIFNDMNFYAEGGNMDNSIMIRRNLVDVGYLELLGIKLLAGRSFTGNRSIEATGKLIVNKTTAKRFGFEPEKMVGQRIHYDWQGQHSSFEVIGVMDDYNQTSLKEEIKATSFEVAYNPREYQYLVVSVSPARFDETVVSLEKVWKGLVGDTPFEYTFLDDTIQRQYAADHRDSKIITCFTVIAIIICSLGLFGLSSFMAERRFKEIGIRKVLGASVRQIVGMMSREFIKLVAIAFVLAVPLGWYAMDQWLQGFAYKVPMDLSIFLVAGLSAILIALLTVSFESVRAATSNPVESLRSE